MKKKKAKVPRKDEKPKVNKELEGFDIEIDAFGEIKTNFDINKINEFLNKEVDDKKLRHRDGPFNKGGKTSKEDEKEEE